MTPNHLPKYTPELAQLICDKLASRTDSLLKICHDNNFPDHTTIYRWLKDPDKQDFLLAYLFAREAQADMLYDEITEIADTFDPDKDSTIKIARDRLRIDVRRWKASRLAPKKYTEKMAELYQAIREEERTGNFIIWGDKKIPI